jgi:transketolase
MKQPTIYVWTHDSIGLGEDGPTHQPVEHLASLRAMIGLDVIRPADANETSVAWGALLANTDRPAALCLTRQNVPTFPRGEGWGAAQESAKGGYILHDCEGTPDVVLIGTGSEVQLAVEASATLAKDGVKARVVSMPCIEWFNEQSQDYRDSVIPPSVKARVSVEAGIAMGWRDIVGDAGRIVSIEQYGASADYQRIYSEYGITADAVVSAATASMSAASNA